MCLIALAWRTLPGIRLLVAANRDEYHARPTAPLAFWDDAPAILGGRDLQDGGTWMAVTREGRFAALTNHRTPAGPRSALRSRGHLVADFLRGDVPARQYCATVAASAGHYNGFNLLAGDPDQLSYTGDHALMPEDLAPGIHTLSNARMNTPWPKAVGLARSMREIALAGPDEDGLVDGLLAALADTDAPADTTLPDTGVGMERERLLAPRMIVAPVYGTRSGSVLIMRDDGSLRFDERSFDPSGRMMRQVSESAGPSGRSRG